MKKIFILSLLTLVIGMSANAQTNNKSKAKQSEEKFTEKFSKFVNSTVSSLEQAGHKLGDAIGFDDRVDIDSSDSIRIDGVYYMPLYDVNLYKGADAATFLAECKKQFKAKYPQVEIQSVSLPQTEWISRTIKQGNTVKGYLQTMRCFVIGRDGGDGYLNAMFTFQRYKDVGKSYAHVKGFWPCWVRTDVIPNNVYTKLKDK